MLRSFLVQLRLPALPMRGSALASWSCCSGRRCSSADGGWGSAWRRRLAMGRWLADRMEIPTSNLRRRSERQSCVRLIYLSSATGTALPARSTSRPKVCARQFGRVARPSPVAYPPTRRRSRTTDHQDVVKCHKSFILHIPYLQYSTRGTVRHTQPGERSAVAGEYQQSGSLSGHSSCVPWPCAPCAA